MKYFFTILALFLFSCAPKEKAPEQVESLYNNAPKSIVLSGCNVEKAVDLAKQWALSWDNTPPLVEHDSIVTFTVNSTGHTIDVNVTYKQKVTVSRTNDGVKITASNGWDDSYSELMNDNVLDMLKLHFNNPSLKWGGKNGL